MLLLTIFIIGTAKVHKKKDIQEKLVSFSLQPNPHSSFLTTNYSIRNVVTLDAVMPVLVAMALMVPEPGASKGVPL